MLFQSGANAGRWRVMAGKLHARPLNFTTTRSNGKHPKIKLTMSLLIRLQEVRSLVTSAFQRTEQILRENNVKLKLVSLDAKLTDAYSSHCKMALYLSTLH